MAILTELQDGDDVATTALYDVFLSFRGKDTRLTFTDHLYQALLNENICTFLDEEEVETGEDLKPELERAIKNSRASIIVLSEGYASSTWCLDELVMILEQRKTSNHIVLPIFYHVEPTHVRKQLSSFGDALEMHRKRMDEEKDGEKKGKRARKLELWTKALTQVADLKGKSASGRRETMFIEEIVKEINSRLDLHLRSNIPYLIGMDCSIDTISSWLKKKSKATDILTIWGMAGIGKTSLAKYIYRMHYHEFERSSFVEDIERRCAQQASALLDLQKQLLDDIVKRSTIEERDVNVYTAKIEKALLSKQTLVVLDGIDNYEQLDVLIGKKYFHPRSKIIVTTKDGSITEKCILFRQPFPPKHTKHALSCLSDFESLQLLCWHAFGGNGPKEGYEEQATRVAKYCGGHPLALKVLGSSLINADVPTWCDTCEMLETKEFPVDIQKVLRISYDSLPSENCKELFKHIACFFVGKDREVTETIMKECGIRASSGITKLMDRCLLTIGGGNKLMMHQLLQEMGRDLVRQESPKKPWKRSRIWNHEESLKLLKEEKGTEKVQGLLLNLKILEEDRLHRSSGLLESQFQDDTKSIFRAMRRAFQFIMGIFTWFFLKFSSSHSEKYELRTRAFNKMDKLQLLQLNYVTLNGSYNNFPKGLRWLCMHGFQLKHIPSDLPMEKLVVLDLSYSHLKQLWKKPKILKLSCSKIVRVGGFLGLPALEKLILVRCQSLVEVCESIGGCNELVLLDISDCKNLKKLPSSMGKLKKLKVLSIDGCIGLGELPREMKDMESLQVLMANDIGMRACISKPEPRCLNSLMFLLPQSLQTLSLAHNNLCTETFPRDFSRLSMLNTLILDENPIESIPDCVRTLRKLKALSVARCWQLKSVLCPPSTILALYTEECPTLMKITFNPEISTPPFVTYEESESLMEIEGVIKIQTLARVHEDILRSLGWTNLEYAKSCELQIWDSYMWRKVKKLPVQMFYEFGIFSTCFPGKAVPNWLAYKCVGPSISFIMPSSPMNKIFVGLNICFVHTFVGTGKISFARTKVRNITKNQTWVYYGYMFGVQEGSDEEIVWLSHWMFRKNEFEDGDEVSVIIIEEEEDNGVVVRECGISPMYGDGDGDGNDDEKSDPLIFYRSWKHIIGGDLHAFELTSGDYFISHDRFFNHPRGFKDLFQHRTTQKIFGYIPQYEDDASANEYIRL